MPALNPVIAPFAQTRRLTARSAARETDSSFANNGGALPAQSTGATRNINVVAHPLARFALAGLRDRQTPPGQFRSYCSQLLAVLAIDSTRTLPTREEPTPPSLEFHGAKVLGKPVVFIALSRHGLGLAHQVADFIPNLSVGLISVRRAENARHLEARLHLVNAPALNEARVILFNPVVATGLSTGIALDLLRNSGAEDVVLLSFLTGAAGLDHILKTFPGLTVWTAAIESDWDCRRGPLPGLGDFGERLYG